MVTAFFAVAFAVMSSLNTPPLLFVIIAVFFTLIGLSQALLFQGQQPRKASVVAGAVLLSATAAILFLIDVCVPSHSSGVFLLKSVPFLVFWLAVLTLVAALTGAVCGYVVGCLIASVFLVKQRGTEDTPKRGASQSAPPAPDGPSANRGVPPE